MTCRDCIHYDVCKDFFYEQMKRFSQDFNESEVVCEHFKDKTRIIELPMSVAEWLRKELAEHCYERCMEEL